MKTTGAKIAKVALKVAATVVKTASHLVSWIPGVGKPIGRAMKEWAEVQNTASDAIHVHVSDKWDRASRVMDRIQHPLSEYRSLFPSPSIWNYSDKCSSPEGAAGAAFDAIMKRDAEQEHLYERDLLDNQDLFERDVEDLDARSFDTSELDIRSFEDAFELEARSFDEDLEALSFGREDIGLHSFEDIPSSTSAALTMRLTLKLDHRNMREMYELQVSCHLARQSHLYFTT